MTTASVLARLLRELEGPTERGPDTPSQFAADHSRGRWQKAPHFEIIEQACLDAINEGTGVILSVAVRHGKSEYASHWLPAWYLGRHPDRRVLLATHEATFAQQWGRRVRDTLSEYGKDLFGVAPDKANRSRSDWTIGGHQGGMLTVGVGGSPIGRGADLIIIDDPFKSWEDGMSALSRRRVQEWWTGTMESRREPGGAAIIICARWHEDDLSGFLLDNAPDDWREVKLPALCDDPATDPLHRETGAALWPDRYTRDDLFKAKQRVTLALGEQVWDAQYQQTPSTPDGGMFTNDWPTMDRALLDLPGTRYVRGWDLAATMGGGDWTVGALLAHMHDGRTVIVDILTGQWAPDQVRDEMLHAAQTDPPGTRIIIPQDPGQAGKDQAQQLTRMLAGFNVTSEPQTGSKETRANGLAAQQRAGNVAIVQASWNRSFTQELAAFPRTKHDDQVDATATAFNALHAANTQQVVRTRWVKPRTR